MKLLFLVSAAFGKLGIKQTKFFSEKEFTVKLIPLNRIRSNRSIISKKATRTTVDFGPVGQSFMVARVAVNTFTVQMPLSDFVQFRTTMRHGQRVIKSVLYPMELILEAMCRVSDLIQIFPKSLFFRVLSLILAPYKLFFNQ